MDKGNNRISIKINGNEQLIEETSKNTEKIQSKSSNLQEESLAPLKANEEIAAAKEDKEEFDWVLPTYEEVENDRTSNIVQIEDVRNKPKKTPYMSLVKQKGKGVNRRNPSGIKALFISIILAVIVGLGLGAMILNLISDVEDIPASVNNGQPSLPVNSSGKENEEAEPGQATPTTSLELPPIKAAAVQLGKFTTKESANSVVEGAKGTGFPATAIEADGFYFVFIGIGLDKGKLSTIDKSYEEKVGDDPWPKEYIIEGGSFTNVNEKDANYVDGSHKLFMELLGISSSAFETNSISEEQWSNATKVYDQVKGQDVEGLSEPLKSYSIQLSSAFDHLKSFQQSKEQAVLWKSQQSLLDALYYFQQWKNGLS